MKKGKKTPVTVSHEDGHDVQPQKTNHPNETDPCAELKQQRDDYQQKYLRALADYQNIERRARNDGERIRMQALREMALQLLPFLDNLEKAEVFVTDQGLSLIRKQYEDTLKQMGLEEIDVLDKPFDPETAEAVDVEDGEKENSVIKVIRKGYRMHGQIVRVAQVTVSRKS